MRKDRHKPNEQQMLLARQYLNEARLELSTAPGFVGSRVTLKLRLAKVPAGARKWVLRQIRAGKL